MTKKLLSFAAFMLLLASCTQSRDDQPVQPINSETSNYRSLDEGLKIADMLFNTLGQTRSSFRTVKSVETINRSTRSSSPGSAFHIVNYNNGGFALLSADKRLEAVFAISEAGQMNLSDTIHNKPLALYIRSIERVANRLNAKPANSKFPPTLDTMLNVDNSFKTFPILDPIFDRKELKNIMPIFHQRDPFNKYCFTISGEQAPVGCAPLAAGTLMGYYEWPQSYKGYTFDWTAMKSNRNHDGWAKLFSFLGQYENMNVNYRINGSGASSSTFYRTFANLGYKNMQLKAFSISQVNYEMREQKPLMVWGYDDQAGGHAWIIDGAKYVEDYMNVYNEVITSYYYHCVWGWGGKDNGYFIFKNNINTDKYLFEDIQYMSNLQH